MDLLLLVLAGAFAGAMNAAVGAGTLVTFPVLLATGMAPIVANGTSSLGLLPGNVTGTLAYRERLRGNWSVVLPWMLTTAVGSLLGSILVVGLPSKIFNVIVPWLILTACALVLIQPLVKRVRKDHARPVATLLGTGMVGIYGGYFGAGQGVAYLAVLGSFATDTLQQANAYKNVLAGVAGVIATTVFCVAGIVSYGSALLLAVGALIGGSVGGNLAKLAPEWLLRLIIVGVGVIALIKVVAAG